jgi:methylenetetrahydrofolate dehydrogenase (NADP+)/methenyltetrahydrofolate cyclohydrolase
VARILDPADVASAFRDELRETIRQLPERLVLAGLLVADHGPSKTYAEYTRKGCEDVGVTFDLRQVQRLEMEDAVLQANAERGVHGIIVYYPVFGTEQDGYLRDLVDPNKDIEGLHSFWARCLYANRRYLDEARTKKAILPCTPLAILKLLEAAGALHGRDPRPLEGKRACIFNRSEVVGRPLASMLANDGAEVLSFDIDGALLFSPAPAPAGQRGAHVVRETNVDRAAALRDADIVITGVPSRKFAPIGPSEIRDGAVCLNFSTVANFQSAIVERASTFVPRVGPMTVTMALRNTVRLYCNGRLPA